MVRPVPNATAFPIHACWVQRGWRESGLALITIVRRQPRDRYAIGGFLADFYCLGVKEAFSRGGYLADDLDDLIDGTYSVEPQEPMDVALAHELIYGSIEYAARLGFKPHRDFAIAKCMLDPPDAHPRTGEVPFGFDGQPYYIQGPNDNWTAIVEQLERTVGEGNFGFLLQSGPFPMMGDDDDSWLPRTR